MQTTKSHSQKEVAVSKKTLPEQEPTNTPELHKGILVAEVTIRGIKPLLMSSPQGMYPKGTVGDRYYPELDPDRNTMKIKGGKRIKENKLELSPEALAELAAYREKLGDPHSALVIPRRCIYANLKEGSKRVQLEGRGLKLHTMMTGSISVEPENAILVDPENGKPITKYEIHVAKVTIPKTQGSIMKFRPVIDHWQITFQVKWMPTLMGVTETMVRSAIEKAANIGLLDFKPTFGLYEIVRFDVKEF